MPHSLRLAYFAHAIRSDWNNGNAHFLRGLLRNLVDCGHDVVIFEPEDGWSISNLHTEPHGKRALRDFASTYPQLRVTPYCEQSIEDKNQLRRMLAGTEVVILHEWNPPSLAHTLLTLRDELGFRLLFHDTHHRAFSSPDQIRLVGVDRFDGVVVFGRALYDLYRQQFNVRRVWILHEAADTSVFRPVKNGTARDDVVWIGNWGDEERTKEITEFLLHPAAALRERAFAVYGVRYPPEAVSALNQVGIHYRGYLANLDGPATYASANVTMHIPRRHYRDTLPGIPTIRVFEALACGIPLVCAPWEDTENLFRKDDLRLVRNSAEMTSALNELLVDSRAAQEQAESGLQTVLARHTCRHRAEELTAICQELLG
jgi:spore maturation protein CgeB